MVTLLIAVIYRNVWPFLRHPLILQFISNSWVGGYWNWLILVLPWVRILQHYFHHEVFGWLPFFKFSFGSELPSSGQHFVPSINTILSGLTNLCEVCTKFIIRNKRQDLGPWFLVSKDILIHKTQLLKILLDNADCPLYTWMHAALQSHFLKSINCKFWAMIFTLSPKMLCPTLLHRPRQKHNNMSVHSSHAQKYW